MRAISMTVRKRMGRSYIKALSEETVEEAGQKHGGQAEGNVQCLRRRSRRGNSSLETLYSLSCDSSSSSGVGSGSKNRQSLWLDVELPYAGPFCGRARVHTDFVPSPYDADSLRLKVGDVINVISKTPVGIWTGILRDKVGTFKFIYVDLLEEAGREKVQLYRRRSKLPEPATLQEFLEKLHLEEHASTLLLNGYQTVEDLRELTEQHLCELNMTDPEQRRLLLATTHSLSDGEDADEEKGAGHEEKGAGHEEKGAGHEEKGAGHEEKGAGHEEKGAGHEEKGAGHEEKGAGHEEKGAGHEEKGAGAGSAHDSGSDVTPESAEKNSRHYPDGAPCQHAVIVQT
ncbi:SAM domain-containing protein SAMSN-1-like isoform X2 [Brienomyrus brachyistius]|nr:SAM domain-containing protein SAMSN-1-like isoform X2 [Brienomyrus brachyistius]